MTVHYFPRSRYAPAIERFLARIEIDPETGCWNWTGYKRGGRGILNIGGVTTYAYRFSYEHFVGEIPDGALICHHCDNGACNNPDHLYAGDHSSNLRDAFARGRRDLAAHREHNRRISPLGVAAHWGAQ